MKYVTAVNRALDEMLAGDARALVCGQLVKYGTAGITTGLYEKYQKQIVQFPVSEALMNASAMGLALAGTRCVMIHERMDFVAVAMDALINHIPIWPKKCGVKLPLVIVGIVGKGHGQGPQHSKNFSSWFANFEGWTVFEPGTAEEAYRDMKKATSMDVPVFFALHRELFNTENESAPLRLSITRLCGASKRHEHEHYD